MSTSWQPKRAAHLIILAMKEVGKPYVFGSEGPVASSLKTWDCSEIVQHLLAQAGVEQVSDGKGRLTPINEFDGAGIQWERSRSIPLDDGISTQGALLFVKDERLYRDRPHHIGHVAISLGNGYLLEARGRAYGVVIGEVRDSFNLATKVDALYLPAVTEVIET